MSNHSRRPLAKLTPYGVTHLHRQNPFMVVWWSAMFPGFGHFLLNQYLRGTFLTLSEVITNSLGHINEAMVYSFCGKFEQAKSILEPRWMFGYIIIFFVAIWDSYRTTLYQNKLCHLAELEDEQLPSTMLFNSEIQYLEQRNPKVGIMYSLLFPGMGQMYSHRIGLAFYAMFWWWFYITFSRMHESILYILLGRIPESIEILHPHWMLFMPSVMGGSVYHAYITVIDHNKLYQLEQRQHLASRYRDSEVRIFSEEGVNGCS